MLSYCTAKKKGCLGMKFKRILNYFLWIPFAVAIGAFALYFRYLFEVKFISTVTVTALVTTAMNRYLKIGLFSLFIGLLLLFISKLSKLIFNEDKYYNERYPWTDIDKYKEETKKQSTIDKTEKVQKQIKVTEPPVEEASETVYENVNDEYKININPNVSNKIANDIKSDKVLKARFIDKDDEKMIEILTDDSEEAEVLSLDKVVLMPETKKETVIKVDSSKVHIDGYKHCPKCKGLVDEDAVICVNCGILLNDKFKKNMNKKHIFNPISFAINAIIIILGIIAIIVMCNKIQDQKTINESKVGSKTSINEIIQ